MRISDPDSLAGSIRIFTFLTRVPSSNSAYASRLCRSRAPRCQPDSGYPRAHRCVREGALDRIGRSIRSDGPGELHAPARGPDGVAATNDDRASARRFRRAGDRERAHDRPDPRRSRRGESQEFDAAHDRDGLRERRALQDQRGGPSGWADPPVVAAVLRRCRRPRSPARWRTHRSPLL